MKVSDASAEQRREGRDEPPAGQLFVVDLIGETSGSRTHGIVLNISRGGMAVQTFRPLAQGSVAEMGVSFPQASLAASTGTVAWQERGGLAGIRFKTPLKDLPELRKGLLQDGSAQSSDSALPLFHYRNKGSANAFDSTLHLFACSAMALTGATGAAIAIGNSNGMECRASAETAPEVGTQLRPESGISGHSMRTGEVILCNDAWSDSRVNAVAARQMDTRSILIVPILMGESLLGLLEAFSREPNHFDEIHVQQLLPFANVLAEAIKEETDNNTADESDQGVAAAVSAVGTDKTEARVETQVAAAAPFTSARFRFHPKHRGIAIAGGVVAVLLIFVAGMALFFSRYRTNSPANRTPAISTDNARASNVEATEQGAVQTVKPVINFSPPVIDQKVGATFSVNIVLKGAKNIGSAPMQVLYDPQKLEVIAVSSGGLLDRYEQLATLVYRVDSSAGRIDISIARPLSAPGISGDGAVFNLVFMSKAAGRSTLRVSQTGLRDTSAKAVSVITSEALVTISESTSPAGKDDQAVAEARTRASPSTAASLASTAPRAIPQTEVDRSAKAIPVPPQTISSILLPLEPPAIGTGKAPAVIAPTIALAPRSPEFPNFVLERTLKGHTNWVTTVAFSADGRRLVSGSWDQSVKVWDVATGQGLNVVANKVTGIQASALSHNGRLIAAEDASDNIRIWNATTGEEVRTIKGDRPPLDASWVFSIAFSPDDVLLAAALNSKTVRLWDVNSGNVVRDFTGSSRGFIYVAFSPDGRWLATGGDTRTIEIWDVATGKVSKTLKGHKQDVYAVAFSPDGRWLASASRDKTVKVWEVSSGREVHTLRGHESSVTSLAFSPNSRWLATSSWDKTVRIWDVESGSEVQILTGHTHPIYSLAFDSHGGWLATGSADGTINLWRLRKEIDLAVLGETDSASTTASVTATGRPR